MDEHLDKKIKRFFTILRAGRSFLPLGFSHQQKRGAQQTHDGRERGEERRDRDSQRDRNSESGKEKTRRRKKRTDQNSYTIKIIRQPPVASQFPLICFLGNLPVHTHPCCIAYIICWRGRKRKRQKKKQIRSGWM